MQDDETPTWNESVLTSVPARAFDHWLVGVWDSDIDLDDEICSFQVDLRNDPVTYQDLFNGVAYEFSCDDPQTGTFADIVVRLQPN